jgi:GMP reductase
VESVVKVDNDWKLDFRDVLIRPRLGNLSSRKDVVLDRTFQFPHSGATWTAFPLVASNMDATGTIEMARALSKHGAITALSKYYPTRELIPFFRSAAGANAFFSVGISSSDLERLQAVKAKTPISKISVEVANGYIPDLPKFVSALRRENPKAIIMAGSVCTPEGTQTLLRSGADIARVGIGSGSVCITRQVTGVGFPQLAAVIECSQAAHEERGLICSDGGCIVPGDICKAFGAGADFVMLGGMLAGHRQCAGAITYRIRGSKRVPVSMQFYGMASDIAQEKHFGGKAAYRASEGKIVSVPYRGNVEDTILAIKGGLRSMMTYIDASVLPEVHAKTEFVKVEAPLNTVLGTNA